MDETIEGYMALCICILCNVPPDVAFRCYETGRANVTWTHEDMQRITVTLHVVTNVKKLTGRKRWKNEII